jgi:competence protein ComEC
VSAARPSVAAALLVLAVGVLAALAVERSGEIRERVSLALGDGMPAREAALARGFVLGEDQGVDSQTEEDFRRSGLAHLLAVSGQNVALLLLLAMPVLAAFGLPLRARLVWMLGLIAAYVPLAGAGPSIQRAGVMGALNVLALLAGRRASRFYALAVAAVVTLAVDPRLAADIGWQLSFAALLGILFLATPLREAVARRIGEGGWRRALAEGTAMTVAATIATAPLVAFHFGELSTTTLAANLLVLPAVAPAMWLGMLAAAAAQVPGVPVEVLNALNAPLLAYIAQVAEWCGRPGWASLEVELSAGGLAAAYAAIALAALAFRVHCLTVRRRPPPARAFGAPRRAVVAVAVATGALALLGAPDERGAAAALPRDGLRVSVLDVGQGDAILLQPATAAPVLVDTGPPGAALVDQLAAAGVARLGAVVLTHDQSDHTGGLADLIDALPVQRVVYAFLGRRTLAAAAAAAPVRRVAAGSEIRSGGLRLEVLWPPAAPAGAATGQDPNEGALVLLLRWRDFAMLLSADAEAESTPLDPGPLDALKVAHHGSEDGGLAELLRRGRPRVAVISAGEGNPFGHPTADTVATLTAHDVRTWRTDRDGTVVLDVTRGSFRVAATGG